MSEPANTTSWDILEIGTFLIQEGIIVLTGYLCEFFSSKMLDY